MDRLEQLRAVIDNIVRRNPEPQESRSGFVHLYGVSAICTMLALKRGLDPELCSVAGLLHDIWNYQEYDCPEHGELGAIEARKLLIRLGNFSEEEIDLVCDAIAKHGDKLAVDGRHAELLKDADVFQHYLYNPHMYIEALSRAVSPDRPVKPAGFQRLEMVLAELGLRSIN